MDPPIIQTTPDPTTVRRPWARIAARTATVLLGLYFFLGGAYKLAAPEAFGASFAAWGYPAWFLYVVGALEAVAAALLIVPRTTALGGLLLTGTMAGAVLTHIEALEWALIALPMTLGILTAYATWHYTPGRLKAQLADLGGTLTGA